MMRLLSWIAARFERSAPPTLTATAARERDVYRRLDLALGDLAQSLERPERPNGQAPEIMP